MLSVTKDDALKMLGNMFRPQATELNQTLDFIRQHGVTLAPQQVEALTLANYLQENGYGDFDWLPKSILTYRPMSMPTAQYEKIVKEMAKAQAAASNPAMMSVMTADKKK